MTTKAHMVLKSTYGANKASSVSSYFSAFIFVCLCLAVFLSVSFLAWNLCVYNLLLTIFLIWKMLSLFVFDCVLTCVLAWLFLQFLGDQILDMKDARVETALEMDLLMERVPESIRFSKVSNITMSFYRIQIKVRHGICHKWHKWHMCKIF